MTATTRRDAARKLAALAALGLIAAVWQDLCGPLGLVLGGAALLKRGAT